MKLLLDTNILLRFAQEQHAQHLLAMQAVDVLLDDDHELAVTPQVLYENWVVATKPESQNGLGMSMPEVDHAIEKWLRLLSFLPDHPSVYRLWKHLVTQHQVLGKKAHDARLAATAIFFSSAMASSRLTRPTSSGLRRCKS
jgi:predicted nucleic acid-binding protein